MLQAKGFPFGKSSWTDLVFSVLLRALLKSKNFKVRINAAACIECIGRLDGMPARLDQKHIVDCLQSLVEAAKNVDVLHDVEFSEFKYQEQLLEQVRG